MGIAYLVSISMEWIFLNLRDENGIHKIGCRDLCVQLLPFSKDSVEVAAVDPKSRRSAHTDKTMTSTVYSGGFFFSDQSPKMHFK
jgi:hypothetical protein